MVKNLARLFARALLGRAAYERIQFRRHVGYWPSFSNPESFNEKICARKMASNTPEAIMLQDKYEVRRVVRERVGDKYLTKLFGVIDSPGQLDYESLPNAFVLKSNNGCGPKSILIVEEKYRWSEDALSKQVASIFERSENFFERFYYYTNEWWYGEIPTRVIIEEYLNEGVGGVPLDYKFFVFHGRVAFIQVDFGRFVKHTRTFYDRDWERQAFMLGFPSGPDVEKPKCLTEMIRVAEAIANGYEFLRVDLYEIDDRRVVFGEVTFAPDLGHGRFEPLEWDKKIGSLWQYKAVCNG